MAVPMGQMRHTIQILRAAAVDDGFASKPVFAAHGDPILARKLDVSDGERFRAGEVAGYVMSRFQVHSTDFTDGITTADRLQFNGQDYEIIGVKDLGDGWQLREITAQARAD
jgi:hypothetical protein